MSPQPIRRLGLRAQRPADAAHHDRDLRRLLALWRMLTARYLAVQAHDDRDAEAEPLDAISGPEGALRGRHRRAPQAPQAHLKPVLLQREHTGDEWATAAECLACKRLADGLPVCVAQLVEGGRSR